MRGDRYMFFFVVGLCLLQVAFVLHCFPGGAHGADEMLALCGLAVFVGLGIVGALDWIFVIQAPQVYGWYMRKYEYFLDNVHPWTRKQT